MKLIIKYIPNNFKRVSSLMLSFNIHEITIFIMYEYHNQLLIRIRTGLSGPTDKTKRSVGLPQEQGVFICAGSNPITVK